MGTFFGLRVRCGTSSLTAPGVAQPPVSFRDFPQECGILRPRDQNYRFACPSHVFLFLTFEDEASLKQRRVIKKEGNMLENIQNGKKKMEESIHKSPKN